MQVSCWSGSFSYQACCTTPILSLADAVNIERLNDRILACGCGFVGGGTGQAAVTGELDWCQLRQAIMLNWDVRPFYIPFLQLSVERMAECPMGTLVMMLLDSFMKLQSGQYGTDLSAIPSFQWAEEMWVTMLRRGEVTLAGLAASGWHVFAHVANVRETLLRRGVMPDLVKHLPLGPPECFELEITQSSMVVRLRQAAFGGTELGVDDILTHALSNNHTGCSLAQASFALSAVHAMRERVAPPELGEKQKDPEREFKGLLVFADQQLRSFLSAVRRPLAVLMATQWPVLDQGYQMSFPGRVDIPLDMSYQTMLDLSQEHVLRRAARRVEGTPAAAYAFRVFPHREMVSDMVRYSRLPFCGLRPFMRMVAATAAAGAEAGCPKPPESSRGAADPCTLTLVEGGPHFGDCTVWAAATLRLVGVRLRAVAFEALSDASGMFHRTAAENALGGDVEVRPSALGSSSGGLTRVQYNPGHNGEANVIYGTPGQGMVVVSDIPVVALDDEVPAAWPVVDVVKLSVNGAERDTITGARRLLSQRRICSVMIHAMKANRGRDPTKLAPGGEVTAFSSDLAQLLTSGDLDVFTQRDLDDRLARRATMRPAGAAELDAVFNLPDLRQQDYILARSKSAGCALARRAFDTAEFGLDAP